jgi:succinyl-CoA synthetase beta subunit
MAADAKLGFDDNAAFRQKELFAKRDTTQEDPRWRSHSLPLEDSLDRHSAY